MSETVLETRAALLRDFVFEALAPVESAMPPQLASASGTMTTPALVTISADCRTENMGCGLDVPRA